MFGLDKETLLKRNIVEILDQENDFMTAKELVERLGHSSTSKILKCCKEIKEILNLIYKDSPIKIGLIINQHNGIRIERTTNDFLPFYTYIYTNDLSYQIIKSIIIEEYASTELLKNTLGTSESSLRRKIRNINDSLKTFDIYISGTKNLVLIGEEKNTRIFFFLFLWSFHRQLSYIDWIDDGEKYESLSQNVFSYLESSQNCAKRKLLALWIYIFDVNIVRGKSIYFTDYEITLINFQDIPNKPDFLLSWDQTDWEALVMIIQHSGFFSQPLSLNYSNLKDREDFQFIDRWIHVFESSFLSLSDEKKKFVKRKLLQQYIISVFCNFVETSDASQAHSYYYKDILSKMPQVYQDKFEFFWEGFIDYPQQTFSPIKSLNFLLFTSLFPSDYFLPHAKIYLLFDLNEVFEEYLKQYLVFTFGRKCHLSFVSNIQESDIVLSNLPSFQITNAENASFIFVRSRLYKNDLDNIWNEILRINEKLS